MTHLGDVALNTKGNPRIYWYEGKDNGTHFGGPKRMANYTWNGSEWVGGSTNLPIEARGELVKDSKKEVKYLLAHSRGVEPEIAWWSSKDGGKEFTKGDIMISGEGNGYTLAHFVLNGRKDAYVVATQKIEGTNFSKVLLIGKNGVIAREKSEADVLEF